MAKAIKPKHKKASAVFIRKQRKAKADKEFEKQKERVLVLLREHIPGLFEPINVANYDVLMPLFIELLQNEPGLQLNLNKTSGSSVDSLKQETNLVFGHSVFLHPRYPSFVVIH